MQAVTSQLNALKERTKNIHNIYKPTIFHLSNQKDREEFDLLLKQNTELKVFDSIRAQTLELLRCLQPIVVQKNKQELEYLITEKIGDPDLYGVWVYYPWSSTLVHLLKEEDFVIVRTNRNKYKITHEEQQTLATKKIGIMGLSVGQSVALTLAMERGFGELRIADFDELDLSNLNRIRTGVQDIGLRKTVVVAREIAEIDPFLNVTCYHDGITEENLESFLTENGKLDLLIDECDSFDIKISARDVAKKLQIPVLMEGSDRGTIDIERFDIEPDRPILHGLVAHLDMTKYKDLKTLDERTPYITAVTGLETLSPRMKASAVELMATISTWPQLASAVTFGGGVSADLSRKILLNQLKVSGRFFLDLDEMIVDKPVDNEVTKTENKKPLTTEEIEAFIASHQLSEPDEAAKDLTETELINLIDAAKKAPSGGNNQPWRWHYQDKKLHLFLDESAALAYLDPQFISSYTSLGSAIENLFLAASIQHIRVKTHFTPHLAPKHIAIFTFADAEAPTEKQTVLAQQISLRHTNRKSPQQREELSDSDIAYLTELVTDTNGANLTWLTDLTKIKSLAEIATQTDLLRMFIPDAHEDFITKEMRWTVEQALATEDGIGIHTLDLSNNDTIGLTLLKDKKMIEFLAKINGGSAFNRLLTQQFMSSSAIGLITMPLNDVQSWIKAGMAAEQMWLGATSLGLQIHPVNVPIIFFYKNSVQNDITLSENTRTKLAQAEIKFNSIFDKPEEETAMFMFRIFKDSASPERTIRKSNDKIFSIGRA